MALWIPGREGGERERGRMGGGEEQGKEGGPWGEGGGGGGEGKEVPVSHLLLFWMPSGQK